MNKSTFNNMLNKVSSPEAPSRRGSAPKAIVRIHAWVGQVGETLMWPKMQYGDHIIKEGDSWPLHVSLERREESGPITVYISLPTDPARKRRVEPNDFHGGQAGDIRVDPDDWQYKLPGGEWQSPITNGSTLMTVTFDENEGWDYDPQNPEANAKTIELRFLTDSDPQEGIQNANGEFYEVWGAKVDYQPQNYTDVWGPTYASIVVRDDSPIVPPTP